MPERRKKKNLKATRHHLTRKKKAPKVARVTKAKKAKKPGAKPVVQHEGSVSVFDLKGKTGETIQLDPMFRGNDINRDVIYQVVLMYQAGEREGTAATKDRGHVSGGGKKPWKQKGTGQARHGSRRSPLWRHGGVTFGPMPRDYSYSVPVKIRKRAVAEGMKDKVVNGKLIFLKDLQLAEPRTRLVADILNTFKLEKPLFLVDKKTQNLMLASRNIPHVAVKTSEEVNALDVVSHRECLITKAAYAGLVSRLKTEI